MEKIDSALAELANKLGVRSDEFIDWLTGVGFESYANLQIIRSIGIAFIMLIVGYISYRLAKHYWNINKGLESYRRDDLADIAFAVLASATLIAGVAFFCNALNAAEWMFAPEGHILEMLMTVARSN